MHEEKPNSLSLNPKARFQYNLDAAKRHREIAASKAVMDSLEAAMAEMVWRQNATSPIQAADAFNQIQGAKTFIKIWLNLGDPQTTQPRKSHDLTYDDTATRQKSAIDTLDA